MSEPPARTIIRSGIRSQWQVHGEGCHRRSHRALTCSGNAEREESVEPTWSSAKLLPQSVGSLNRVGGDSLLQPLNSQPVASAILRWSTERFPPLITSATFFPASRSRIFNAPASDAAPACSVRLCVCSRWMTIARFISHSDTSAKSLQMLAQNAQRQFVAAACRQPLLRWTFIGASTHAPLAPRQIRGGRLLRLHAYHLYLRVDGLGGRCTRRTRRCRLRWERLSRPRPAGLPESPECTCRRPRSGAAR